MNYPQKVRSVRSERQAESSGVEEPSLTIQSRVDSMATQMLGMMTKSRGSKVGEVGAAGGVERRGGVKLGGPVAGGFDGNANVAGDDEVEGIEAGGSKGGRQGGKRIELRLEVDEAGDENVGWDTERERREADGGDLRG
ncbi:hypothetical protein U1Q18_034236 [Sarracenia purpurea var. burkii]